MSFKRKIHRIAFITNYGILVNIFRISVNLNLRSTGRECDVINTYIITNNSWFCGCALMIVFYNKFKLGVLF